MDNIVYLIKAAVIGLVEGVTEFLPISSTAHILILGNWLNFDSGDSKVFEIAIQLGAILAVIVIYRQTIWDVIIGFFKGDLRQVRFVRNLLLAFMPAVVIGLLLNKAIERLLDADNNQIIYAITLFVGGLIMLWVESRPKYRKIKSHEQDVLETEEGFENITWKQALIVGFAQCLAMIPGTSRSGSTIIAGMLAGIPRKVATEFSFLLAIPTMIGATTLMTYKHAHEIGGANLTALIVGFVMAFISALLLVKWLLRFISKYSYRPFAWYRMALGVLVAVLVFAVY